MSTFKKCKAENCENKQYVKGYCTRHRMQIKRYGKILERTNRDPNEIIDCGDYYEICLYNKKCEETGRVLIDKEDLDKVKNYKWHKYKNIYKNGEIIYYGATNRNKKNLLLHQLIIVELPKGCEIDHQSHNGLDNRKQNLRIATISQNQMNRKNVKGYYWNKQCKKWQAQIMINGKSIFLGMFNFNKKEEAKKVSQEARQKYFGEYAYKK